MRTTVHHFLFLLAFPLLLFSCRSTYLANVTPTVYGVGADTVQTQDQEVLALIAPYKQQLDEIMDEPIGEAPLALPKQRPESTLGNWLGDAVQHKAIDIFGQDVAFSFLNYGGVRVPALPAGAITKRHIYELMPFDNTLVLLTMDGRMLKQLIDHMAADGGWPVSGTLRYIIDGEQAAQVTVQGAPIDPDKEYSVAMPDYIANGGSRSDFLQGLQRIDSGVLIRDLLIEYTAERHKQGEQVATELDGRIKNKY